MNDSHYLILPEDQSGIHYDSATFLLALNLPYCTVFSMNPSNAVLLSSSTLRVGYSGFEKLSPRKQRQYIQGNNNYSALVQGSGSVDYGYKGIQTSSPSNLVTEAESLIDPSFISDEEIIAAMVDVDLDVMMEPKKTFSVEIEVVSYRRSAPFNIDPEDIVGS